MGQLGAVCPGRAAVAAGGRTLNNILYGFKVTTDVMTDFNCETWDLNICFYNNDSCFVTIGPSLYLLESYISKSVSVFQFH